MRCIAASKNRLKEAAKLQQKKYREETGLFAAEGAKVLEELISENIKIKEIYALKEFETDSFDAPVFIINEADMKKICSTDSAPEILTIAEKRREDLESFKKLSKIVLLESVSDPGNLGAVIRSAAAFGIDGIILFKNCTDLYSAKVIRSAAGNFFKLPFLHLKSIDELQTHFKNHIKIASALSRENNITLKECAAVEKRIIMLGSEAQGLSADLISAADKNIRLNMKRDVESLNLACAASVIFYELDSFSEPV